MVLPLYNVTPVWMHFLFTVLLFASSNRDPSKSSMSRNNRWIKLFSTKHSSSARHGLCYQNPVAKPRLVWYEMSSGRLQWQAAMHAGAIRYFFGMKPGWLLGQRRRLWKQRNKTTNLFTTLSSLLCEFHPSRGLHLTLKIGFGRKQSCRIYC